MRTTAAGEDPAEGLAGRVTDGSPFDWPRPEELKPYEGHRVRIVIGHRFFRDWASNGEWEGTLLKAHADWWTCLLELDDGTPKFLDLRPALEWRVLA